MTDTSGFPQLQAEMELALIIATVFRRYEFELHQDELKTREGFLRKPLGLQVGMRKRAGVS
jgi:benzoate 4-monooxygenase